MSKAINNVTRSDVFASVTDEMVTKYKFPNKMYIWHLLMSNPEKAIKSLPEEISNAVVNYTSKRLNVKSTDLSDTVSQTLSETPSEVVSEAVIEPLPRPDLDVIAEIKAEVQYSIEESVAIPVESKKKRGRQKK